MRRYPKTVAALAALTLAAVALIVVVPYEWPK